VGQGTQAFLRALALVCATPVGTVPAATVETEREVDMMLQHWHAQQRTSISAVQRRFCGVVGVQNGGMRAVVHWMPGPPPLLRLTFQHARLADDAEDARPAHDINGVPAITRAIDTDNGVLIDNITQLELQAVGFEPPVLADGPATGALLQLVITTEGPAALPYRIGQMFSIDGSNARPSMRYCITPEPPQRCEAAYAAVSLVEAALVIARLGVGANIQAHAAAAAQAGPAVGVPVGQVPPAAQAAPQAQLPPVPQAAPQAQPQLAADAPRLANIQQPRAFPWTGAGDYSIMDQLCTQLSPADLTNMERWDQLVKALTVSAPPGYAFQPPDEVMARVDYCNTRINDLMSQHDIAHA